MAAQRRTDDETGMREKAGETLKRRGILAAAGVAIAGLVAKQAAEPVLAVHQVEDVGLNIDNASTGNTNIHGPAAFSPFGVIAVFSANNTGSAGHGIAGKGPFSGVRGEASTGNGLYGYANGAGGTGVLGESVSASGTTYGVFGRANQSGGIGVYGMNVNGIGVSGDSNVTYGVLGTGPFVATGGIIASGNTNPATIGVLGLNQSTGAGGSGVFGTSTVGTYGVYGTSGQAGGVGVRGDCTGGYGVFGNVSDGFAVFGQAVTGNGIRGFAQQNHAIVGQTGRTFYGGVYGVATADNTVGIYGSTSNGTTHNANAFAGYMDGNFVVANGVKSAAVPHKDGSHRLVYCVESPESWLEDFGEGKVVNGHAEVKLDADFAAVVDTAGYQVFLTTYGTSQGLDVVSRSVGGFSVQERNKGTSSLTFGYRVVAKRKDIVAARLAKFELVGKAKVDVAVPKPPPAPSLPSLPPTPQPELRKPSQP